MRRSASWLAIAVACGCRPAESARPVLADPPAAVCDSSPLLIELTTDSGFALNKMSQDSASLAKWIAIELPQFPPNRRNLLMRGGESRARDVAWIVAAAEDQHAHVFRFTNSCFRPVAAAGSTSVPEVERVLDRYLAASIEGAATAALRR